MTSSDFSLQPDQPKPPRQSYQKGYWRKYKNHHRQVVGTLTLDEYDQIKRTAKGFNRGVWSQIWLESCAYRHQQSVPIPAVEKALREAKSELRRIGNNINQIAIQSHVLAKLLKERQLLNELEALETGLKNAVQDIKRMQ